MRLQTQSSLVDPAAAAVALEDASDREHVFELLVRAVGSLARFAAVVVVHADQLRVRRVAGGSPSVIAALPRTVPAFEKAIEARATCVASLQTGESFVDGMLEQLGGPTRAALIVPIVVGGRVEALLVAHDGPDELAEEVVEEILPLTVAASSALARGRLRRATTVTVVRHQTRAQTLQGIAPERPVVTSATRHETAYEIEIIVDRPGRFTELPQLRDGDPAELADALREVVREGMATGTPDEDTQLALLVELGELDERRGEIDAAIETYRSALTIDGSHAPTLDALEALLARCERWGELAELHDQRIALADDRGERIDRLLELAVLAKERLDDPERAVAAYERIVMWEPDHPIASRELELLYTERDAWEPMAALLLDRASRELDVRQRTAALEVVARLYFDRLGDRRAAFLVWLTVLRVDPSHATALDELARLWTSSVDARDELFAEAAARAAELEAYPSTAARLWRMVARWAPDVTAGLDVVRALEHAHRLVPDDADLANELAGELRTARRWTELAVLRAWQAERESEVARRCELLTELGDIHETLGEVEPAIAWYQRAIAADPQTRGALEALCRLYRQAESWLPLALVLPGLIGVIDDDARCVELHVEHGRVLSDRLGRHDDAIRAYRRALAIAPRHAAAFRGIARACRAIGRTEEMLEASESALATGRPATAEDDSTRYSELATSWYERGRFDRAAACWRRLIELEPAQLAAHDGLAQTLYAAGQWSELAAALRATLELDVPDRAPRLLLLGEALEKLDDIGGAIAAVRGALASTPDDPAALDRLATLYERAGDGEAAIATLQRRLAATRAPRERADVFQRLGSAYLEIRDLAAARLQLVSALALDLANAAAHEGMARVLLVEGEVVAAGEELLRAAELSSGSTADKLRRLADAAWLFRYRLRDADRARACLRAILELDPEHRDARAALAGLLADNRRWHTLWDHLGPQVESAQQLPAAERREILLQGARCALELDDHATARRLYDRACEGDAPPAILLERAGALARMRALEDSAVAYEAALAAGLEPDAIASATRELAAIYVTLGKTARALHCYRTLLELSPGDPPTLAALAELHAARGRYDEAIASLRVLVERVPAAERVRPLEVIGDLYRDQFHNPARATSAYLEALEIDPRNHRILQRLLDLQTDAGQWRAAVDTIQRFLAHETDHARRAAYHLAEAAIRRTELVDKPGALDAYEHALDELFQEHPLSPETRIRALQTFRIVDELVTAERDWRDLERRYLRMIERVGKHDPILVVLWHALGELYRSRLRELDKALQAFQVAHALDGGCSADRAAIIAELYQQIGETPPPPAVETAPDRPDGYRAVLHAARDSGELDAAWCAARALVVLGQATAEERALYLRYRDRETAPATRVLDEERWSLVRHRDEDLAISEIFSLIWPGPVALRGATARTFELKAKERLPVEDGARPIARIIRDTARLLQIALPDVYLQPKRAGRLLLASVVERGSVVPTVIVGRDLFTTDREPEIAHAVGVMFTMLRPGYYLRLALPAIEDLEAALAAACRIGGRPGGAEPTTTMFAVQIQERLSRATTAKLRALVDRLPAQPDLARWRAAVDVAAQRAGLLACGELAAAVRMQTLGARAESLVAYSVSPAYLAARAHLGIATT